MAGKGAVSNYVFFNNEEQKFESPAQLVLLATVGRVASDRWSHQGNVLPRKQELAGAGTA